MKKGKKQDLAFATLGTGKKIIVTGNWDYAKGESELTDSEVMGLNRKSKRALYKKEKLHERSEEIEKDKALRLSSARKTARVKKKKQGALRRHANQMRK